MPTTILIADDHASWRADLKRLLEQEVEVTTVAEAGGGEEAIHVARALRPDVVFMDIAIPHVNGLEATRRIQAEQEDDRSDLEPGFIPCHRIICEGLGARAHGGVMALCRGPKGQIWERAC